MRRLLVGSALALLSTVFTLLAAEFLLWALGLFPPMPRIYPGERADQHRDHFQADPHIGWRMRPHARFHWTVDGHEAEYLADAEGFRTGPGAGAQAEPGGREVILVGDSFVWGFGVPYEATVSAQLEHLWPGTRVKNLAMPGFGVDQIVLTARHYALPQKPDLLIVGLFLDDFNRSFTAYREAEGYNKPTFRLRNGELEPLRPEHAPGLLPRFLDRHSRLLAVLRRVDRRLGRQWGQGTWFQLNTALIHTLRHDAQQAGVPLLFVLIPPRENIPFPALAPYFERHSEELLLPDWPHPRDELYFPVDAHLNAAGHEALAQAITAFL